MCEKYNSVPSLGRGRVSMGTGAEAAVTAVTWCGIGIRVRLVDLMFSCFFATSTVKPLAPESASVSTQQ